MKTLDRSLRAYSMAALVAGVGIVALTESADAEDTRRAVADDLVAKCSEYRGADIREIAARQRSTKMEL